MYTVVRLASSGERKLWQLFGASAHACHNTRATITMPVARFARLRRQDTLPFGNPQRESCVERPTPECLQQFFHYIIFRVERAGNNTMEETFEAGDRVAAESGTPPPS